MFFVLTIRYVHGILVDDKLAKLERNFNVIQKYTEHERRNFRLRN
jgi:hypothetical protein